MRVRLFAVLAVVMMGAALLSLGGCGENPGAVATLAPSLAPLNPAVDLGEPSPMPTLPPTPSAPPPPTATPTMPPSPTPEPLALWLDPAVPPSLVRVVSDFAASRPSEYLLTDDPTAADLRLAAGSEGTPVATWVYALVAPFPTLTDGVSWDALRAGWVGEAVGPFAGRPLLMSAETLDALTTLLGQPATGAVSVVPDDELLQRAWAEQPAWAVVPFEALEPRWKVLRVDEASPLERGLDLTTYPLVVSVSLDGRPEATEPFVSAAGLPATNRDERQMTVVAMTGVTALTRAVAWRMEQKGLTYPGEAVGDWLRAADITHVSNEVSFDPECGPPDPVQVDVHFCSDPRYIALLEDIGVDVVEMTGNHIGDYGIENIEPTLDMYVERGWQYFGGGRDLDDARQPAIFEHNGNRIAFVGCNSAGPGWVWATDEHAGAAPCGDYQWLYDALAALRAEGVLPIVTVQYWEEDRYSPTPQQVTDFQALAEAGAVIVSGSQAHHAQGFGFHAGGFIHFGVGNLFFDQMELMGNRQEFIDRHVFYQGRHISTELLTALLEDWSRPRPMTADERRELLQTVFAVSVWP